MNLTETIDKFAVDIYFLMPGEIMNEFNQIIEGFIKLMEQNFTGNAEAMEMKNTLLTYLLNVVEKKDYIAMADALKYELKPFVVEVESIITQSEVQ